MGEYVKCYYGKRSEGREDCFVAAKNQKEAAKVAEVSMSEFKKLWAAGDFPKRSPKVRTLYLRFNGSQDDFQERLV